MTTVGEILKIAREKKKLTLQQVELNTRIRSKFLEAIENNDFSKLPPGTFAKGFIKNYATFLGLSPEDTLAFYRRQVHEDKPKPAPERKTIKYGFSLTPQIITTISVSILIILFFGYLIFSYFKYAGSPMLVVNSPANNQTINVEQVEIIGKTDPEATLSINNETVNLNENGSFDTKISLQPGLNTITITSTNKFHRQTTLTRNIRLEK